MQREAAALDAKARRAAKRVGRSIKKSDGKFVLSGGHYMRARRNLDAKDVIAFCEKRLAKARPFLQKTWHPRVALVRPVRPFPSAAVAKCRGELRSARKVRL
jgi:hypothetical protein